MKHRKDGTIGLAFLLYVDDAVYCGDKELIADLEKRLNQKFKLKMREQAKVFIGVTLERTDNAILMHQNSHIVGAVSKFGLDNAKKHYTPIVTDTPAGQSEELAEPTLFRSLMGVLNYVSNGARPGISYACSVLSRHMQTPRKADYQAAKRCLSYLNTSIDRKTAYRFQDIKKYEIVAFTDSSWGNGPKRRTMGGYGYSI